MILLRCLVPKRVSFDEKGIGNEGNVQSLNDDRKKGNLGI